jgi:urease accessory protein
VRWPYALTCPFRLDTAPADMLTIMVQSASGAIVAGDRVRQRIEAGAAAALHVTSQSATAVHSMPPGIRAEETIELVAGEGAFLEHLPEPRILFPRAELVQRVTIDLGPAALAIVGDGFLTHDPAGGAEPFRRLAVETVIRDAEERVLAVDRMDTGGEALEGTPWRAHGWLAVLCAPDRLDVEAAVGELEAALVPIEALYAGVSALPSAAGIGLRLAAREGQALRRGLETAWATARRIGTGEAPGPRRKGGWKDPRAHAGRD